jgi:hypothetical protein
MEMALTFINTKIDSEMYIKTQFVPHIEHTNSQL